LYPLAFRAKAAARPRPEAPPVTKALLSIDSS
jgi:hypothetical protein